MEKYLYGGASVSSWLEKTGLFRTVNKTCAEYIIQDAYVR
jgi:hypothetical protein